MLQNYLVMIHKSLSCVRAFPSSFSDSSFFKLGAFYHCFLQEHLHETFMLFQFQKYLAIMLNFELELVLFSPHWCQEFFFLMRRISIIHVSFSRGALPLEGGMGMCHGQAPLFAGQSALHSLPIFHQCAAHVPPFSI